MEDTLITFETAKLAKQKGFDWSVYNYYDEEGILYSTMIGNFSDSVPVQNCFQDENYQNGRYAASTQSLLQKWLREKHKIYVMIEFGTFDSMYPRIYIGTDNDIILDGFNDTAYSNWEECLEKALQEGLKLIKL